MNLIRLHLLALLFAPGCATTHRLGAVADSIQPPSPGTGMVAGRVVDDEKGKPLAGVSVVVSGPAGEQTEFTDSDGRYVIANLIPSSENVVRFFYADQRVDSPSVIVPDGAAVMVNAVVPTSKIKLPATRGIVCPSEPAVDLSRSDQGTSVTPALTGSVSVP